MIEFPLNQKINMIGFRSFFKLIVEENVSGRQNIQGARQGSGWQWGLETRKPDGYPP
jgi:hypothetical protein